MAVTIFNPIFRKSNVRLYALYRNRYFFLLALIGYFFSLYLYIGNVHPQPLAHDAYSHRLAMNSNFLTDFRWVTYVINPINKIKATTAKNVIDVSLYYLFASIVFTKIRGFKFEVILLCIFFTIAYPLVSVFTWPTNNATSFIVLILCVLGKFSKAHLLPRYLACGCVIIGSYPVIYFLTLPAFYFLDKSTNNFRKLITHLLYYLLSFALGVLVAYAASSIILGEFTYFKETSGYRVLPFESNANKIVTYINKIDAIYSQYKTVWYREYNVLILIILLGCFSSFVYRKDVINSTTVIILIISYMSLAAFSFVATHSIYARMTIVIPFILLMAIAQFKYDKHTYIAMYVLLLVSVYIVFQHSREFVLRNMNQANEAKLIYKRAGIHNLSMINHIYVIDNGGVLSPEQQFGIKLFSTQATHDLGFKTWYVDFCFKPIRQCGFEEEVSKELKIGYKRGETYIKIDSNLYLLVSG